MPRMIWSVALTGLLALPPALLAQAGPGGQNTDQPAATVTGCLTRAGDGEGFELIPARPAPAGTTGSTLTSPAPGTSATGAAPSGSVTGETPTGSTATTAAAPTPAVGESGATANPASPTYNRPTGAASTAVSVARPDTGAGVVTTARYIVKAGAGVDLASHVGHMVEVNGRVEPGSSASPAADRPSSAASAGVQTVRAERLTRVSAECPAPLEGAKRD